MSTEDRLLALGEIYADRAIRHFSNITHWGESPIERLLIGAMLVSGWDTEPDPSIWCRDREAAEAAGIEEPNQILWSAECACFVVVQAHVLAKARRYRADFAFVYPGEKQGRQIKIAVELDGHDFHEKTKEQARNDKRRDRAMTALGWTMLRFTGSEVYADPEEVLEEIRTLCNERAWG